MHEKAGPTVKNVTEQSYTVDLSHAEEIFCKNPLGFAAGTFLNLIVERGDPGHVETLKSCPQSVWCQLLKNIS